MAAIVELSFKDNKYTLECKPNGKMDKICNNFCKQVGKEKEINLLSFIYDNKKINKNFTFIEQANRFDKEKNKIFILVFENEKLIKNKKRMK